MVFKIFAGLFGGLGLFLLGMRLMTKGLRKAAGPALRAILGEWTRTPFRGLFSGFFITAIVQSSSAVTVALIGFVNAGLMNTAQSLGVIFGSNIGTTVTGWIVAAVGVSVSVKALALPLIGIGSLLRLTGGHSRRTPIGDALAGFGLFFLGIEVLQSGFALLQPHIDLTAFEGSGILAVALFLAIGFILTLLMQSSSAAMALVLTAALSGVIDLNAAAAAVIGTNIGTTSTAALSVIGATINARKVAAAHIIFNLFTGLAALAALPLLLAAIAWFQNLTGMENGIVVTLALFHTFFNTLGVVLFMPFTKQLANFLEERIGGATEPGRPRFLDENVLIAPAVAMEALFMELGRMGESTRHMANKGLANNFSYPGLASDQANLESLALATQNFCIKFQRLDLSERLAEDLPKALRVVQYYMRCSELLGIISKRFSRLDHSLFTPKTEVVINEFRREVTNILNIAHTPCSVEFQDLEVEIRSLLDVYHRLKKAILDAGAAGEIPLPAMADFIDFYSLTRRLTEQAVKGTLHWADIRSISATCRHAAEENDYTWKPPALEESA